MKLRYFAALDDISSEQRPDDGQRQMIDRLRRAELVAHALQNSARIRRRRKVLEIGQIRQQMLAEARHVDGFLRVHVVIDGVDYCQQHRRDDAAAAGRPHHHHRLAPHRAIVLVADAADVDFDRARSLACDVAP